jgi:hypothetical protein
MSWMTPVCYSLLNSCAPSERDQFSSVPAKVMIFSIENSEMSKIA